VEGWDFIADGKLNGYGRRRSYGKPGRGGNGRGAQPKSKWLIPEETVPDRKGKPGGPYLRGGEGKRKRDQEVQPCGANEKK